MLKLRLKLYALRIAVLTYKSAVWDLNKMPNIFARIFANVWMLRDPQTMRMYFTTIAYLEGEIK